MGNEFGTTAREVTTHLKGKKNVTGACRTAMLAISVALSALAGPALAEPLLVVVTRAGNVNSEGFSFDHNNKDSQTSGLTPGEIIQSSVTNAAFQARADFGSLGVHAHAVMPLGPQAPGQWQVVADGSSSWTDTVHISSNNPAVGTVSIQVDLVIDIAALTSTMASPHPASQAYARTLFTTNFVPGGRYCLAANVGLAIFPSLCDDYAPLQVGRNSIRYVMDVAVGEHGWQAELQGNSTIIDGLITSPQTSGEVLIDAMNTAHTYFTVLTPGASIVFDSGHDFSAPVGAAAPAPATLALLALGLMGLGVSRRKRVS